jgi:hypothetical protein
VRTGVSVWALDRALKALQRFGQKHVVLDRRCETRRFMCFADPARCIREVAGLRHSARALIYTAMVSAVAGKVIKSAGSHQFVNCWKLDR